MNIPDKMKCWEDFPAMVGYICYMYRPLSSIIFCYSMDPQIVSELAIFRPVNLPNFQPLFLYTF